MIMAVVRTLTDVWKKQHLVGYRRVKRSTDLGWLVVMRE